MIPLAANFAVKIDDFVVLLVIIAIVGGGIFWMIKDR